MENNMYNLQIRITKELESQLKHLAKLDERSLRIFCKKILEDYVSKNYNAPNDITTNVNNNSGEFDFESLD